MTNKERSGSEQQPLMHVLYQLETLYRTIGHGNCVYCGPFLRLLQCTTQCSTY